MAEHSAGNDAPDAVDFGIPDTTLPPASLKQRLQKLLELAAAYDTVVYASILLAAALHLSRLTQITSPAFWIAVTPILYLLWVFLFLVCSAISTGIMLKFAPKPRNFIVTEPGPKARLPLLGAGACYQRWMLLQSLPLIGAHMCGSHFLRWLAMRAYSGNPRCLNAGLLADFPLDPDLTEVGRQTIIGGGAILTAHSVATHPDCMFTYATAPIRIGNNVTIGAGARVEMGCQMGDGSVLEPGSVLTPFSIVGPGEVWGGVPAKFVRVRTHPSAAHASPTANQSTTRSESGVKKGNLQLAQSLVNKALDEERDPDSWDSLDQMAIAAALYAHTQVAVPADEIFQLQTLDDVAARLSNSPSEPQSPSGDRLPENPELLPLLNRQSTSSWLARQAAESNAGDKQLTVVVAASFTADLIAPAIQSWSLPFGADAEIRNAGFNQILPTLLNPDSPMANNHGGINVVLQAAEDLPEGQEQDYADNVLDAAEMFLKTSAGTSRLCIATLPTAVSDVSPERRDAIESARSRWNARLRQMADVDVIDLSQIIDSVGTIAAWDRSMQETASCPYSMQVLTECGVEIARVVRRLVRPRAKVLAIDCDNTLWGGVVGEVGLDGIDLGTDAAGRHYRELQQWILSQQKSGILVVIVSRNEEHDVWSVFDRHPEMILKREQITAHRINWAPKSENLRSLAEQLNLGLDSFVFLDDDPAVRLEVESSLPEVTVVPMMQPSEYVAQVRRLWAFDASELTDEDRQRGAMMAAEQERTRAQKSSSSFDDYLAGLRLKVAVREASDDDLSRVAQLTQKTNQFNLSVIRRSQEELRNLSESRILAVSVTDRFGDYGTVGVAILTGSGKQMRLDTFLLSCRVLGRQVEHAFLAAVHRIARDSGAQRLIAPVVETPRNTPARSFVSESGASNVTDGQWEWNLSQPHGCPEPIELTIALTANAAL